MYALCSPASYFESLPYYVHIILAYYFKLSIVVRAAKGELIPAAGKQAGRQPHDDRFAVSCLCALQQPSPGIALLCVFQYHQIAFVVIFEKV